MLVPRGTIPVAGTNADRYTESETMVILKPKQWEAVRARHARGESFEAIARSYGCHAVTIRTRAKKEGWVRQVAKIDHSVQKETDGQKETLVEKKGIPPVLPQKPLDEIGKEVRSRLATNIATTLERVAELRPEDMREEVQLETVLGSLTKRAATVFGWSETQSNVLVSVGLLGALPDRETDVTPPREERAE